MNYQSNKTVLRILTLKLRDIFKLIVNYFNNQTLVKYIFLINSPNYFFSLY